MGCISRVPGCKPVKVVLVGGELGGEKARSRKTQRREWLVRLVSLEFGATVTVTVMVAVIQANLFLSKVGQVYSEQGSRGAEESRRAREPESEWRRGGEGVNRETALLLLEEDVVECRVPEIGRAHV